MPSKLLILSDLVIGWFFLYICNFKVTS